MVAAAETVAPAAAVHAAVRKRKSNQISQNLKWELLDRTAPISYGITQEVESTKGPPVLTRRTHHINLAVGWLYKMQPRPAWRTRLRRTKRVEVLSRFRPQGLTHTGSRPLSRYVHDKCIKGPSSHRCPVSLFRSQQVAFSFLRIICHIPFA